MRTSTKPSVVILGGGYAGLMALARIRRSGLADITLIDAKPAFEQRIRHHQHVCGQHTHRLRYDRLGGIRFVQARAERIDPHFRLIYLQGQAQPVLYDYLVYALGSQLDNHGLPGAREYGLDLCGEGSLLAQAPVWAGLAQRRAPVTVIGGGLTAIEMATELAEHAPGLTVRLVSSRTLGQDLSPQGAAHMRATLLRLGVDLIENTRVTALEADAIQLADGRSLPSARHIPLTGMRANPLAGASGLPTQADGRLSVANDLSLPGDSAIFAAGDGAAVWQHGGQQLRFACATALPQGGQVGDNVVARLKGLDTTPFAFGYVFRCVSLGRRDGLVQFVDPLDSSTDKVWVGRRAAWLKESICRYTWMMPWMELHGLRAGQFPRNAPADNLALEGSQ